MLFLLFIIAIRTLSKTVFDLQDFSDFVQLVLAYVKKIDHQVKNVSQICPYQIVRADLLTLH